MDPAVTGALIALAGTVAGGWGGPWITGRFENHRAKRAASAARLDRTLEVIERGASAFLEARLQLDQALQGNQAALDSVALYRELATSQNQIALRLGASNPITRAYDESVEHWTEALNLAVQNVQGNKDAIVAACNAAFEAKARFLDLAAAYFGPDEGDRPHLPS